MRRVLIALVLTWAIAASPVQAARLALVIGINHYDLVPPLQKAIGDATAMSSKLNELGFAVTTVIDPDRRQFNQAIETFRESLHAGDVALCIFPGMGSKSTAAISSCRAIFHCQSVATKAISLRRRSISRA